MHTTILSIHHALVRFQNKTIFSDLAFGIETGQHWAVVGASGSGKSALLQTIAGRFNITGGTIDYHFFNELVQAGKLPAGSNLIPQKFIALVEPRHHFRNLSNTGDFYYQQRYNSSDSEDALTVDDYLSTIKAPLQPNPYWTKESTLEKLNLVHLRDKQIIKLSNGETRRLTLAAALLKNPVILLLDNPLTGLDVQTRQYFSEICRHIAQSGISIVMATSPHELPDVITDVAILKDCTVSQTMPREQFREDMVLVKTDSIDKTALSALITTGHHHYEWIVKMNGVNISYGDKQILKDVDWQIAQGDRWALLGHNGAGKSTLLSLINGDNPQAYANDIILFDRKRGSGESIWDIKRKIGFVSPELYQYFPTDNSCLQVIESGYYDTLGLFRPSQPQKAETALKWMKALEIDQYARTLLKNIPASAQRLCLLARALVKNPALLIFDEPCQGMDDHQQQHFKNIVNTVCELSDVTLIYVTHYQHEIPDSVNKVLKLDKGAVV